ncbi:hypothetical protein PtA15_4A528 [Puccinia triticina]|nr:uncharacterized protein PtA15_4A528 [Puccinia triticina]WAQ84077.1 hypothetical protein PtA15_4A528 [Puccinia triticina]
MKFAHLDLYYANLPRLSTLNHEIIYRHSGRVKHIMFELDDPPPRLSGTAESKPSRIKAHQIFQERRSSQVYDILQSCTSLTRLTLDIEPQPISIDELGDFAFNVEFPSSQLLKPISKLSNLTFLTIRPPIIDTRFEEDFVVRLIKGMVHLVHFECNGIDATIPEFKSHECSKGVNVSPLALHLSSLSSLKTINFTFVHCFDGSWSQIKWKAAMCHITIDNSSRATIRTLHSFCMLFKDSLKSLCVSSIPALRKEQEEGPSDTSGSQHLELRYHFCLPRSIFLGNNAHISIQQLKRLMDHREPIWPNLKYLTVETHGRILSDDEIERLKVFGSKSGVKVICDNLTDTLDGSEEESDGQMEQRGPIYIRDNVGSYTW